MANLNFLTFFQTLDPGERSAYRKYLRRMYSNNTVALEVFEYIRKQKNTAKLDIPYLCRKLYQDDSRAVRKNLLNTLSDLFQWLKEFLLINKLQDKSLESQLLWLCVLQQKNLSNEFSKHALAMLQKTDAMPRTSMLDYLKSMALHHYTYYHFNQEHAVSARYTIQKNLQELEHYTLAIKLRLACLSLHLNKIQPTGPDLRQAVNPLEINSLTPVPGHPLLEVYRLLAQLIDSEDASDFDRVEAVLTKHAAYIAPSELDEILLYLFNYASAKVRHVETPEDWKRTHQLNLLAIKHKVFTQKGELPAAQFLNIVNAASKAKEFQWAKTFTNKQKDSLPADIRKNAVLVAQAIINTEAGNFQTVVRSLENVQMKDLHLQIRSGLLLLVCYYELRVDEDKIFELCSNFERFLRSNRNILEKAIKGTHNFVRIYKMLVGKRKDKDKIREQIEKADLLYFRAWLNEKIQSYEATLASRRRNL